MYVIINFHLYIATTAGFGILLIVADLENTARTIGIIATQVLIISSPCL